MRKLIFLLAIIAGATSCAIKYQRPEIETEKLIRDFESSDTTFDVAKLHWKEFYKQIALAYGVGLRLDFSIFVFRVDFGVKLYDPSRLYGQWAGKQWRTVTNGLNWKEDMSFHFAIGYPF